MKQLSLIATVFAVIAVAIALSSHAYGPNTFFLPGLWAGSVGFLVVALGNGAWQSRHGRLLFAALGCCALGDFFGPGNFEAGVLAFAIAHLLFAATFLWLGVDRRRLALAIAATAVVSGLTLAWLLPHVARESLPLVLGYCTVISIMLITALALRPPHGSRLIIAAALIFYVSDIFVARWRFVDTSSNNAYLCYPLYYTACLLFAWAPRKLPRTS